MTGYGIIYFYQFDGTCKINNEQVINKNLVEIWQKGFEGSAIELKDARPPVITIEYPNTSDFIYSQPIQGSLLEFHITGVENQQLEFDSFLSEDETEYLIKYYRDNATSVPYWTGFITADLSEQIINSRDSRIVIKAIDNLGALTDDNFEFGTNEQDSIISVAQVITKCLLLTNNTENELYSIARVFEEVMDSTELQNPLTQAFISAYSLRENASSPKSAYDVLEGVLNAFNCQLFQEDGRWKMCRIPDVSKGKYTAQWIDKTGINTTFTVNNVETLEHYKDFKIIDGAVLTKKRMYKKAELEYKYGFAGNILRDGSFKNPTNLETCTKFSNMKDFIEQVYIWSGSAWSNNNPVSEEVTFPILNWYEQNQGGGIKVALIHTTDFNSIIVLRDSFFYSTNYDNPTVTETEATFDDAWLEASGGYLPKGATFEMSFETGDRAEKTQLQVVATSTTNVLGKTYYLTDDGVWSTTNSILKPYDIDNTLPNIEDVANKTINIKSEALPDNCNIFIRLLPGMSRGIINTGTTEAPDYSYPIVWGSEFRNLYVKYTLQEASESHTVYNCNKAMTFPEKITALIGDNLNYADADPSSLISPKLPRQSFLLRDFLNYNFAFTQSWSEEDSEEFLPLLEIATRNIINQYNSNRKIFKGTLIGKNLKRAAVYTFPNISYLAGGFYWPMYFKSNEYDCRAEVHLIELNDSDMVGDYEKYVFNQSGDTLKYDFKTGLCGVSTGQGKDHDIDVYEPESEYGSDGDIDA